MSPGMAVPPEVNQPCSALQTAGAPGIWVLTKEYNDYDQHGAYFVYAWRGKPTGEQLAKQLLLSESIEADRQLLDHILAGGGREKWEDSWYNLEAVK